MKRILIITPHYPPSNLAAVHRSRLFAQHLPLFGWEPIILTVHEDFYEEALDWNLHKLLPAGQRIEKVNAFPVTRPRLVGDIGLRAFLQLRKKAVKIIRHEKIDFVYIPIPSFYVSLLGPYLLRRTGTPYGIDYIDPWVHQFPGSDKWFSRHWWSTLLARWLEPKAVRRASLITGVAEGYYNAVRKRNPHLTGKCLFGAMPYGFEATDFEKLSELKLKPYLFQKNGTLQFVYAGAMLPKAYTVLEAVFRAISRNKKLFGKVEFHFIGTGKLANDPNSYNIRPLAEKYSLWHSIVFEYPKRIPYLDVLIHLQAADAVFILGSTEPHYTPSKAFQAVASKKPVMAILHKESTAVAVLQEAKAGKVLSFQGEKDVQKVQEGFNDFFLEFLLFQNMYEPAHIDFEAFRQFSAEEVTSQLVSLLNSQFSS